MLVNSMHDLVATVKGRRSALGLSQREVAERVGVSRDWVNSFERGKRTVELALVLRLLDALDMRLELMETEPAAMPGGATEDALDLDSYLQEYFGR